jgi:hypothetical protein
VSEIRLIVIRLYCSGELRPKVTFVSIATYKGNKVLFETESLKSLNNSIDPAQNISAHKQFNWPCQYNERHLRITKQLSVHCCKKNSFFIYFAKNGDWLLFPCLIGKRSELRKSQRRKPKRTSKNSETITTSKMAF